MVRPKINAPQMENAIEFPSANQAELFLDFEWFVPIWENKPWVQSIGSNFSVQYLFTSPDRIEPIRIENQKGKKYEAAPYSLTTEDGWQRCRPMTYQQAIEKCDLVPMRGEDLFSQIIETGSYYPEARVNPCCGTYDEPHKNGTIYLSSGYLHYLVRGIDPRPETRVLRARSIWEIHLFMSFMHGVHQPVHRIEYRNDELVATYEGLDINNKPKSQSFYPVDSSDSGPKAELRPSEILCGAALASHIHNRSSQIPGNKNPIYRSQLRQQIPELLLEIEELKQMIDVHSGMIAPCYFRKEFANLLLSSFPDVVKLETLEFAREKFQWFLLTDD